MRATPAPAPPPAPRHAGPVPARAAAPSGRVRAVPVDVVPVVAVVPVVLGLPLALAACGGAAPAPTPVTVTVTASLSAPPAASAEATASPSEAAPPASSAPPSPEPSVDLAALPRLDRGFDVALVEGTSSAGGGTVLSIDRLTVAGLDDGVLAREGTELFVDDGDRFSNQTVRLYEVGVDPAARFFLTTCERDGSGEPAISSTPVDLAAFLDAPGLDGTAVTFEYRAGLVVRAETNPRC